MAETEPTAAHADDHSSQQHTYIYIYPKDKALVETELTAAHAEKIINSIRTCNAIQSHIPGS
jgi:hypothetical protein